VLFFTTSIVVEPSSTELRALLDHLGMLLGIAENDYRSWYKISLEDFLKYGAQDVLESTGYNVPALLKAAYPEHTWKTSWFNSRRRFHPSKDIILKLRKNLLVLGEKKGIKEGDYNRWYNIPHKDIAAAGGRDFKDLKFDSCRHKLFSTVFPEHKWHPWLFNNIRKSKFEFDDESRTQFARYLEDKLHITQPEEWYRVSRKEFVKATGLVELFPNQASVLQFLRLAYPDIQWIPENMAWSGQGWSQLYSALTLLFPGEVVSTIFEPESGGASFTPYDRVLVVHKFKLSFLYQGPMAYAEQIVQKRKLLRKVRSDQHERLCAQREFTAIDIPFWWNRKQSSLLSEIFRCRPDLFENNGPLQPFALTTNVSEAIPMSVSRRSIPLNPGYVKQWSQDSRFSPLFFSKES
jgi:hypothetical protein